MHTLTAHYVELLAIARGWALKSVPGWSDETHRDLIAACGAQALPGESRPSAKTMSAAQLSAALEAYERRGWTRQRRQYGASVQKVPEQIAHIVRLWARLGSAGRLRTHTRAALLAWLERQVGHPVANLDALSRPERQAAIEALKAWMQRPAAPQHEEGTTP